MPIRIPELFQLYDQIIRNALGLQTLLRTTEVSIDQKRSEEFNKLLIDLHNDAVDHAGRINRLIIQSGIIPDRRRVPDRRLAAQGPPQI